MVVKKLGLLAIAFVAATFVLSAPVAFDRGSLATNAAFARGNDDLDDLRDFICRRHPNFCDP